MRPYLLQHLPPVVGRMVPYTAVAVANCINIPCMRSGELSEGIDIIDEEGKKLGKSVRTARVAIAQVTISRVLMAAPGMGEFFLFVLPASDYVDTALSASFRNHKLFINPRSVAGDS